MSDSDDDAPPPPCLVTTGDFGAVQESPKPSPRASHQHLGVSPGSPGSSFRWDRGQSFRLFATYSRANFQRRQSVQCAFDVDGKGSPLTPGTQAMTKAALTKLKNYLMLHGEVALTMESAEGRALSIRKGTMVGSGGFASVFVGLIVQTSELVAIKEIKISPNSSMAEFKSIEDEFALLRRLKHKNVIKYNLFEYSVSKELCRIIMEFSAAGSALNLLHKSGGPLPEPVIKKIASDIMCGIAFIHSEGITHRDIKPANILITSDGTAQLADFGCSKRITEVGSAAGHLIGTPVYMAPEFIKNQMHRKSDIWAAACTLLELATGLTPWSHTKVKDHLQLMFHITTSSDIPHIPMDWSDDMRDFFLKCFDRNINTRPEAEKLLDHPFLTTLNADDYETRVAIEEAVADQCCELCETLMETKNEDLFGAHVTIGSNHNSPTALGLEALKDETEKPQVLAIRRKSGGDNVEGYELQVEEEEAATELPRYSKLLSPTAAAAAPPTLPSNMKLNLSVSAGDGDSFDVHLEVEPGDVSMRVIDRRPSYVVTMNDRIKSQLSNAMRTAVKRKGKGDSEDPQRLVSPSSSSTSPEPAHIG